MTRGSSPKKPKAPTSPNTATTSADGAFGYAMDSKSVRSYRCNDMATLKKAVSDNIAEYLEGDCGFSVDTKLVNLRLLVGFLAVLIGPLSHWYPLPFPQIRPLLLWCVITYNVLTFALLYIVRTLEGEAFFLSSELPKDWQAPRGTSIRVIARGGSFTPEVELEFQLLAPQRDLSIISPRLVASKVTRTYSVGKFFDADGYIFPPNVIEEVQSFLKDMRQRVSSVRRK